MSNNLILLQGPSGSGKSTLAQEVLAQNGLVKLVTSTTRSPREGEVDGKDYHFRKMQNFLDLNLLEHTFYRETITV